MKACIGTANWQTSDQVTFIYFKMRRIFLLIIAVVCMGIGSAAAQAVSDSQAIQYAMECQSKGYSMTQTVKYLQSKGVTIEQMQRLKAQYESGQLSGVSANGASTENFAGSASRGTTSNAATAATPASATMGMEGNMMMANGMMMGTSFPGFNNQLDSRRPLLLTKQDSLNRIYGHDLFGGQDMLSFTPNLQIATPQNYVIGAGDNLGISVYGATETDISQTVTPDGTVYVRGIGPITVQGLTIEQARVKLKKELSRIFGGLSDGSTSLNITLNDIRSIQVNVMGEVYMPGTFTLPSLATAFHALYAAGGVSDTGTVRCIRVVRNNEIIGEVDLYKFLTTGDKSGDIALQDGDVVLVTPYVNLVSIDEGVKRPMRYEMLQNETLDKAIAYAGGFTNDAFRTAVNVMRQNDMGLQVFNVPESEFGSFELADGDKIVIGQRYQRAANKVEIKGAVYNAGTYAIDEQVTSVLKLIEVAGGLREDAFLDRALLQREMADWTLEMESIDLNKLLAGEVADIPLRTNDILYIASKADLHEKYTVSISGPVQAAGEYDYAEGMTIKDLIVRAGGLLESASLVKVDVSRRIKLPHSTEYSPARSQLFTITLGEGLKTENGQDFVLEPFDQVYIRKSPAYNVQNTITLKGEVLFAGSYALEGSDVRVSELLKQAGGVTPAGFIEGASLERLMTPEEQKKMDEIISILSRQASKRDSIDSKLFSQAKYYSVGFDLKAALDKPGSAADIILQPGDIITVPEYNGTVQVLGAVLYPNAVAYEQGKKLSQYVKSAGGYSQLARKSKVFVLYMNGTAAVGRNAKVMPGSKIVVPMKSRRNAMSFADVLGIASSTASMASIVASMATLFK